MNSRPTAPAIQRPIQAELAQALAFHRAGDLTAAERGYRAVLGAAPEHADAQHLLGVLLHQLGRNGEAASLIAEAISRNGRVAEYHANLGLALHALDRLEEAEAAYRRALALREAFPEAHNSLGSALQDRGRLEEAVSHYRRALALRSDYADALTNLGTALRAMDRYGEAEEELRRSLRLNPADPVALTNLGVVLKEMDRADDAEAAHLEALRLAPGDPEVIVNLALLREAQGRSQEAESFYRQAMANGFALARWNLAILLIGQGRLAEGRDLYEARFESRRVLGARSFGVPRWEGEDLTGKTIMVWREQGLGDEILYATCLPELIRRAGHVVVECDPRLVSLFARSFPEASVRAQTLDAQGRESPAAPDFDLHVPFATLARFLRRGLSDFPAESRYLAADPLRLDTWRQRVAALGDGLKVGICWRSQLTTGERKKAYTTLDAWAPLFALPGVVFVALQYDARDDEIAAARQTGGVTLHRWADTDLKKDLEAAVALTAQMDLVITVASSVGEFAGALGVPVWRFGGSHDWTMQGTGARPWFGCMRIWCARPGEGLADVLTRMAGTLRQLATRSPDPGDRSVSEAVAALFAEARSLHAAGRLPEAEKVYQRLIHADPNHADGLEGYALLADQAGRPDIAVELMRRAIAADPTAGRHKVRAAAHQKMGMRDEAEADLRVAIALAPCDAEAQGQLGSLLLQSGRPGEALDFCREAARLAPDQAALHGNLGLARVAAGQDGLSALHRVVALEPAMAGGWNALASVLPPTRAEEAARRALSIAPGYADALCNRGVALLALGRVDEAVACLNAGSKQNPDDPRTLANLALALEAAGDGNRAGLVWWRILLLQPGAAEGFAGLADLRQKQRRFDAAAKAWRRAIVLAPQRADWTYNLGNALHAGGRAAEADTAYRRAAELDPALTLATFNRGYAALARGDLAAGWLGLEARFASGQAKPDRRLRIPAWDGGDLGGKTVLVWREQGVGDELMHASCYGDLIARAGRVIVECEPRLVDLFARSFPDAMVRRETEDPGDADVQVAAGSLPRILRTRLADFPNRPAWLVPNTLRGAAFREWLGRLAGPSSSGTGEAQLTVGICWRSRLVTGGRAANYTALEQWAPVFAVPGICLVNLQYDECEGELAAAEARFGIRIVRPPVDLLNDLDGAAALTSKLDLVISAGTSVAEMAGALGVPVWRLSAAGEWTALGTRCRPWFPAMRLITPSPGGTMADALAAVAGELRRLTRPEPPRS